MDFEEQPVHRDRYRIYARDYAGEEPAIVLMHGFPDDLHLHDRLVPHLPPPRRVITFDFLGWGASDKPADYPYGARNQVGDLDAVITELKLGQVVLVAHDASGPSAIDWALHHSDQVPVDNRPAAVVAWAPQVCQCALHRGVLVREGILSTC